jgi:hypothetical protein
MQMLTQLGLNAAGQTGASGASGAADSDGDSDGSVARAAQSRTGQALAAFLHTLFQTLGQNSQASGSAPDNDSSNSTASAVNCSYGGLTANLQNLLQSLNSVPRKAAA